MAKIKQGILGGFSGKVAGVVGTSWKGRAVMKSRPLSVANPRTDAQQEQRGKFSKIAELASKVLTTFVQPVENPISGDISGYNKFVKDNKEAFNASGKLVQAKFVCGGGKLPYAESPELNLDIDNGTANVSWSNAAGTSAVRLQDKVYAVLFNADGELLSVAGSTYTRNSTSANFTGSAMFEMVEPGDKAFCLLAFVSTDGRDVSILAESIEGEWLGD